MSIKYICPHCKNEIESLSYSSNATHYGNYSLEYEEYDETNSEYNDETMTCPECETELTPDDVIVKKVKEKKLTLKELNNKLSNK